MQKTANIHVAEEGSISENTDIKLKEELYSCIFQKKHIQKKYKQEIQLINDKIDEIMTKCPHNNVTYHPDPSGNNDYFYSCDLCGKEKLTKMLLTKQ